MNQEHRRGGSQDDDPEDGDRDHSVALGAHRHGGDRVHHGQVSASRQFQLSRAGSGGLFAAVRVIHGHVRGQLDARGFAGKRINLPLQPRVRASPPRVRARIDAQIRGGFITRPPAN